MYFNEDEGEFTPVGIIRRHEKVLTEDHWMAFKKISKNAWKLVRYE